MTLEQIVARKAELDTMFKQAQAQITQLQEQALMIRGAFIELSEQEPKLRTPPASEEVSEKRKPGRPPKDAV